MYRIRNLLLGVKAKIMASPFMLFVMVKVSTSIAVYATETPVPTHTPTPYQKKDVDGVIDDISQNIGLGADMNGANAIIGDAARGVINTVMGILAWIAMVGIGIFTALDICYMIIPTLHATLEELAMNKGTTTKDGHPKPRFISQDAVNAYKEGIENGKNILILYLKKRVVAYIAAAIVIYMLMSGRITIVIEAVLRLLSGGLDTIDNAVKGDGATTITPSVME